MYQLHLIYYILFLVTGFFNLLKEMDKSKKLESLIINKNNLASKKFFLITSFISQATNLRELRLAQCRIANNGGIILL